MKRNQIKKTLYLPVLVVVGLLLLYFMPEVKVWGGNTLRKVNILADITGTSDSVAQGRLTAVEFQDSVPDGMTPIEDFAVNRGERMMDRFYAALDSVDKLERPVRIAYFGDSFIEGDIMTCDLRELLQNEFGGCGVGAVNVIYPFKNSRGTIVQSDGGLVEHVSSNQKTFSPALQGMNNFYATFSGDAWAKLSGTKNQFGSHLDRWDASSLYFRPSGGMTVSCQVNGGATKQLYSGKSAKVEMVRLEEDARNVKWILSGRDSQCFFAANEGKKGIVVDNFAMRGSSGTQHVKTPDSTLVEFAALRPYDLIIFQYGLNVAHPTVETYQPFAEKFTQVIRKFRKAWPQASIMMVSVSDRGTKDPSSGKVVTLQGIRELVTVQHELAKKENIAFWNMYKVMSDEGGIWKMADRGEANRDYTHMKFKGGKKMASLLYDALMNGKQNYDRRQREMKQ